MNKYSISDLEPEYVEHLYKHIPILAYGIDNISLLQLVLDYSLECENKRSGNKASFIRYNSLEKIRLSLNKITEKINSNSGFNNDNTYIIENNKNNSKIIKIAPIKPISLIESIIFCTLDYINKNKYKNNNKKFIPNINLISNNKKLYLKMSKAPGISLGHFIIEIYKDNEIDEKNKNQLLLDILIEISKKLEYLQTNYGFIHGDFHSGNIFVDYDKNNNKIIINFIDFEYSTIKLPSIKENIILTSPVSENISRRNILNLKEEYGLKALDLFHLIEDLKTFQMKTETVRAFNGNFKQFQDFVNKLSSLYEINGSLNGKIHISTRKNDFFNESFLNLYPEKFSKIKLNNFPQIPIITTKRQTEISHHSYNSPPSKSSSRYNPLTP
jgi:hypothetical protein